MNRKMNFGYDILGNHNLVKLNVGLNKDDQSNLTAKYGLIVSEGRRGLCRLEGAFPLGQLSNFITDLEDAKINFAMTKLLNKKEDLLNNALQYKYVSADLDLPY